MCVYPMFVMCGSMHGCNVWVVYMWCGVYMVCMGGRHGVCVWYVCAVRGIAV